jgi:hypothetical protein
MLVTESRRWLEWGSAMDFQWTEEDRERYNGIYSRTRLWPAPGAGYFTSAEWKLCAVLELLTGKSVPQPVRGSGPILGGATLTSKECGQCHTAQQQHTEADGFTAPMSTTSTAGFSAYRRRETRPAFSSEQAGL